MASYITMLNELSQENAGELGAEAASAPDSAVRFKAKSVGQAGPAAGHLAVTRVCDEHPAPRLCLRHSLTWNACLTPVRLLRSYLLVKGDRSCSAGTVPIYS